MLPVRVSSTRRPIRNLPDKVQAPLSLSQTLSNWQLMADGNCPLALQKVRTRGAPIGNLALAYGASRPVPDGQDDLCHLGQRSASLVLANTRCNWERR